MELKQVSNNMGTLTFGYGWIAPGTSQRWWYRINVGGTLGVNRGASYCMANPLWMEEPGEFTLQVNDQAKKLEWDTSTTYFVTVRNIGVVGTTFNWNQGDWM